MLSQTQLLLWPASGGPEKKLRLAEHKKALRESLQNEPDQELDERREFLRETEGLNLSVSTLWRELRALGWTRKKSLSACEQDPVERMAWRWQQTWLGLRAEDLIFLDESGSNKAIAPRYGHAPRGQRSHG